MDVVTLAQIVTSVTNALFVIVLAAAEVGVGLAIVLQLYRLRASVAVDEVPLDPVGSSADERVIR